MLKLKKVLVCSIFTVLMLLVSSCSNNANVIKETVISNENISKIVKDNLSENMKLVDMTVKNNVISLKIEMLNSDNNLLPNKELAIIAFSGLTDKLLEISELNTFKAEFINFGSIEMNKKDSVKNDYGMIYFPLDKITENFINK